MLGDLTTLAAVKQYASITGTASDALLASLISAASSFVTRYLSRNFFITTYTDTYNGKGSDRIALDNLPVIAVSALSVCGNPVQPSINSSTGFLHDSQTLYYVGGWFPRGVQNVVVTYSAGIATQSGSPLTPINVPPDIAQAVAEMVTIKYQRRSNLSVASETLATQTISYALTDLTPAVMAVLNQWSTVWARQ